MGGKGIEQRYVVTGQRRYAKDGDPLGETGDTGLTFAQGRWPFATGRAMESPVSP